MKNGGYISLSIVLLLTVIVLGIMITVGQLSIGEGQAGLALSNGHKTVAFVEGCMEDALLTIRTNAAYTGGTITRPEGTCAITVSTINTTYTVTATTTDTAYRRTIQAVVSRSSNMTIASWKEI
jgi:uncharacterized protein (UPF0333 family)